jgi:TonB family protein
MRRLTRLIPSAFPLVMLFLGPASDAASPEQPVRVIERLLRSQALTAAPPVYPADAIAAHDRGVVVAEITVGMTGHVDRVEILEAPSVSIATAVTNALDRWRFARRTVESRAVRTIGKITYYFVIDESGGHVYSPDDAPYVGPPTTRRAR